MMHTIQFDADTERRLKEAAEQESTAVETMIIRAVWDYLEDLEDIRQADAVMARVIAGDEEILGEDELRRRLALDD
jgi:predicted DNA-binding protein